MILVERRKHPCAQEYLGGNGAEIRIPLACGYRLGCRRVLGHRLRRPLPTQSVVPLIPSFSSRYPPALAQSILLKMAGTGGRPIVFFDITMCAARRRTSFRILCLVSKWLLL